jgi:UDP-glucose 4-epimerase
MTAARSVLVTGAGGYLGELLVTSLATEPAGLETIVAADLRPPRLRIPGIDYAEFDIRDTSIAEALRRYQVDTVVHLAAVVTAGKRPDRALAHAVDVDGTRNVLEACVGTGVAKLIVTSSGAAYGYHADNPDPIDEDAPLRGNPEFSYSDHKRQVEEMLGTARREHPELRQLVLRPGTILGHTTHNQITALFDRPAILGLRGAATPFVFIWDQDVVAILRRGILTDVSGIYNVAGDGTMTMAEIASRLGKPYVALPAALVRNALRGLRALRLTQYGPEQVDFLRYRPVLDNAKLKKEFGYQPEKTSREAFEVFAAGRRG